MTGANGFLKKNECTVVWAAFRDRNFEVGLPKAMSVPSKYNKKYASNARIFYFNTILKRITYNSQLLPLCLPLTCHLYS